MAIGTPLKRGTTIQTHPSSAPAPQQAKTQFVPTVSNLTKELHPLPVVHLNTEELEPKQLQKQMLDLYEATRVATLAMRQDPESSPNYVRGIKFENPDPNNAQYITQTIKHSLGRPVTGVTCCRAQNIHYQGFEVPNPNGEDPSQYVTIRQLIPAGATGTLAAIHDLKLIGD